MALGTGEARLQVVCSLLFPPLKCSVPCLLPRRAQAASLQFMCMHPRSLHATSSHTSAAPSPPVPSSPRAKYITGTVAMLLQKQGGGGAWLHSLRGVPYPEAAAALCELPGIGPKVAACAALFSLDKHAAIPVDTHVWQIACRHYTPHLRGKSLTKKVHDEVAAALVERFGSHAGWAHNTLFIAELPGLRDRLPAKPKQRSAAAAAVAAAAAEVTAGDVQQPATPPEAAAGEGLAGRKRRRAARNAA